MFFCHSITTRKTVPLQRKNIKEKGKFNTIFSLSCYRLGIAMVNLSNFRLQGKGKKMKAVIKWERQ